MGKGLCIFFSIAPTRAVAEIEFKREMRLAYVIR
jgi:hypothetical protein